MDVVFQMISLVLNSFVLKVILAIVGCTINNVSDTDLPQLLLIPRHQVTCQIQEAIEYFRALILIKSMFVFVSRSPFEIKVLVCQVLDWHLHILDHVHSFMWRLMTRSTITLTLALTAGG